MIPVRPNGERSTARAVAHAAVGVLLAVSLTGCVPAETGLQRDAARQLQQRVLGVSQAAAADDHAAALQSLDGLEADLATASSNGQVSEDRRRSIMATITAVRADLTAAIEATAAAAKAAEEAAAAAAAAEAEKARADAEAEMTAAQEVTAPVVQAPAPVQEPGSGQGKDNEGKAKGKNG